MRSDHNHQPANLHEPFPRVALEGSIGARLDEIARRFPDKQAVCTKNCSWSYAELNARADHIAQAINDHGITTAAPIVLQFEHDAPAIAALLGALKAGHFYCALDPAASPDHNASIVESLRPGMLLCDRANADRSARLAKDALPLLNVEDEILRPADNGSAAEVSPDALAYVFFTSGTTGKPKGVMDSHRNVLHNILRYTNNLHITSDDRLTLLQALSFSGSVSSLFCALLNGATVYPFDLRREGPAALADWIADQRITIYHSVPSIFRLIAAEGRRFPEMRILRLEGDQASRADAVLFQRDFSGNCVLVNGLGATECGIVRQFFLGARAVLPDGALPIGHAVEDMEVSLLDEQGGPVTAGEIGEIAVRSRYLALGYWQQPALTRAIFQAAPDDPQTRIYRTGDLGRLTDDGCLEYLGRKNFQEKVRGQRVALTEVEAELLRIDGVREAVAAVKADRAGENQLVAYYTESADRPVDPENAWRHLHARLESHVRPSALIRLDRLPLNANGKIDRRALPDPHKRRLLAHPPVPPNTSRERMLVALWKEILDIDEVGIDDSFIELGGDSLQAMRILNRVRQDFGCDMAMVDFFAAPHIAALAKRLNRATLQLDGESK